MRLADGHLETLGASTEKVKPNILIWSSNKEHIYFVNSYGNHGNIWSLLIRDGSNRQLTDLIGRPGKLGNLALAADDKYLYFTWEEDFGDIWVMDVEIDK